MDREERAEWQNLKDRLDCKLQKEQLNTLQIQMGLLIATVLLILFLCAIMIKNGSDNRNSIQAMQTQIGGGK